jgi:hypothetical protein
MGQIQLALNRGQSVISVSGKDLGTAFVTVK